MWCILGDVKWICLTEPRRYYVIHGPLQKLRYSISPRSIKWKTVFLSRTTKWSRHFPQNDRVSFLCFCLSLHQPHVLPGSVLTLYPESSCIAVLTCFSTNMIKHLPQNNLGRKGFFFLPLHRTVYNPWWWEVSVGIQGRNSEAGMEVAAWQGCGCG